MKLASSFIIFFILSNFIFAQEKGDSTVFDAEITYTNGSTVKGLLDGFIVKKAIFNSKGDPFANLERRFNFKDKYFTFIDEAGQKTKLKSEEVKHVKLFKDNGDVLEFGRFSIKHLNKKGQLKVSESELWLPYIYKDRISLLGFSVFDNSGRYFGTISFLNREGDDYAIDPMNIKLLDIFSMRKMIEKMEIGLKEVFKECPETVAFIDERFETAMKDKAQNKENRKQFMAKIKEFEKSLKKMSASEKKDARGEFYGILNFEGYKEYFDHFNSNCPEE